MSLSQAITRVLNNAACSKISFTADGTSIGPSDFTAVAGKINSGDITASYESARPALSGEYEYTSDTFKFGFQSTDGDAFREALVAHEATHAALDIRAQSVQVKVSEAAAYLAQALFLYHANRAHFDDGGTIDFPNNAPLAAAWTLSESAREQARSYTSSELQPLYTAIDGEPEYAGRGNENDDYDGV